MKTRRRPWATRPADTALPITAPAARPSPSEPPNFLTKREIAQRLRCSERTVERLLQRRVLIPADHPARRVVVALEQVLRLEERMRRGRRPD